MDTAAIDDPAAEPPRSSCSDEVTTGAANDSRSSPPAENEMVLRWGMSEKLGPRALGARPTSRASPAVRPRGPD